MFLFVMKVLRLEKLLERRTRVLNFLLGIFILHAPVTQEALFKHFRLKQFVNAVHVVQVLVISSFTYLVVVHNYWNLDVKARPASFSIHLKSCWTLFDS